MQFSESRQVKQIMDFKPVLLLSFFAMLLLPAEPINHNSKILKRLRRSPQEQREDLPKCKSAFVNFPKFKLRGCPPPKFCSLSRPLKKRYCVRENSPKFAFPK